MLDGPASAVKRAESRRQGVAVRQRDSPERAAAAAPA
jgi:hypothetical protein